MSLFSLPAYTPRTTLYTLVQLRLSERAKIYRLCMCIRVCKLHLQLKGSSVRHIRAIQGEGERIIRERLHDVCVYVHLNRPIVMYRGAKEFSHANDIGNIGARLRARAVGLD